MLQSFAKNDSLLNFLNKFLEKNPYSAYMLGMKLENYILKKKIKESIAAHEFGIISDETFHLVMSIR